jgi:hypothetical protein
VGSGRLGGESLSDPLLDLRTLEKARTYDVSAGSEYLTQKQETDTILWPHVPRRADRLRLKAKRDSVPEISCPALDGSEIPVTGGLRWLP